MELLLSIMTMFKKATIKTQSVCQVENESNTCSVRKVILTSPKPFPEACFHNQPEEHVLHSANSFSKSLCPKKIGH